MQNQQALHYLETISPLGAKLGLERLLLLLEHLGNPHKNLPVIHVAGTNGKGSTCAMLQSILTKAGYQTGVYTSPHLMDYEERYTINGIPISKAEFSEKVLYIKTLCDKMVSLGQGQPTVFEVLTALGFLYFYEKKVDLLLLEVGLGGRFDATNCIENPILSIITSISMDHMDFLGETLEEIALEKAGIIKENSPIVLYSQGDIVYNVVKAVAKDKSAPFYCATNTQISVAEKNLSHTVFHIQNEYITYENITLSLLGNYQIQNAATVLLACHVLQQKGFVISEEAIKTGLETARWIGRMEIVEKNPLVILDGAHNADGIETLATSIKEYFSKKRITLLVGVLGDKEYEKMINTLLPLCQTIVLTEPDNQRRLPVDTLGHLIADTGCTFFKELDIQKAYQLAKEHTTDVLICCGSLYLIGALRKLFR